MSTTYISPPVDSAEAFRVEIQPGRERVRVVPHGELDIATAPDTAREIDSLIERGFRAIVIDLRRTTFIDSTGVHLLLRQARRPDLSMTVIDGPQTVSRVIDLAGARELLSFEPAL